jgi:elongation factor G
MLFEAGVITRRGRVVDQNTVSDNTELEHERGNSIFNHLLHNEWRGVKLNFIDTRGYDDFVGEVVSGVKVADTAIMVLNGAHGVEVGTELLWEYIDEFGTPTVFVINQLDHEQADYERTLEQAQERFGNKVIPVQFPVRTGIGFNSIVDALRMVMYVFPDGGGKPEKREIPASESERAKALHNQLVEVAAEHEDGLMEKYFEQGTLDEEELSRGLTLALAQHDFFPVFCTSAERNMGSGRLMGFLHDIAPSPADRLPAALTDGNSVACDPDDKCTSVFIFKTVTEPKVGVVSYFKVFSGRLKAGDELINAANRGAERFGQLFLANGGKREPVEELQAGDIGVTVKLKNTHSNQTLNTKGCERQISPIVFPESRIRAAVIPQSQQDMEKLVKALHQLAEEDPTLVVEQSATLKQTLIHGQGQLHLDLVKYRLEKSYGVVMEMVKPRISYRETITKAANAEYRHKKQTGGAGQFAEVHMRIEPWYEGMPDPSDLTIKHRESETLPWGGKLEYFWCIVGGSIDNKFSSAIKKGIMSKMEEGPLTGSPCRDIRIYIYDGKMHPVDSNDMAFQLAGMQAFKECFRSAAPQLMEPIMEVEVLCPDTMTGDVMGDLQTRRAIITGMDTQGHYQKINARVPQSELWQYYNTLRSLTQGRAKYHRHFKEFQAVPMDLQNKLVHDYQEHLEEV